MVLQCTLMSHTKNITGFNEFFLAILERSFRVSDGESPRKQGIFNQLQAVKKFVPKNLLHLVSDVVLTINRGA
jgi:hypothetical protein